VAVSFCIRCQSHRCRRRKVRTGVATPRPPGCRIFRRATYPGLSACNAVSKMGSNLLVQLYWCVTARWSFCKPGICTSFSCAALRRFQLPAHPSVTTPPWNRVQKQVWGQGTATRPLLWSQYGSGSPIARLNCPHGWGGCYGSSGTMPCSIILAYSTQYFAQGWASSLAFAIGSPVPSQIP